MFYGTFSWTRYSYRGDLTKISLEQFEALRRLDASQLQHLLDEISRTRWETFRKDHRALLWVTGIACVSLFLALIIPVFGIVAFVGWVCALSLGFSAMSQALALNRERRFLKRMHHRARTSATFDDFIGTTVGDGRAAAVLTESEADVAPAGAEVRAAGTFPTLERISYFAPPPYPTGGVSNNLYDEDVVAKLGVERIEKLRSLIQSEPYDNRRLGKLPVPPSKIDALICDLWAIATNDAGLRATSPSQLSSADVRQAIAVYENAPWKKMRGFRPWTHWNFIDRLTGDERQALAVEAHAYMLKIGIRTGTP